MEDNKKRSVVSWVIAISLALNLVILPLTCYASLTTAVTVAYTLDELAQVINKLNSDDIGDDIIAELEEEGWVYDEDLDLFYPATLEALNGALVCPAWGFIKDASDTAEDAAKKILTQFEIDPETHEILSYTPVDDNNPLKISGETFSKVCERLKNQYAPHVQAEYDFLTWQNEKNPNYISQLSFYAEGVGFPNGWSECYLVPYYKDEKGSEWYGKTQLHLFISDNKYYTSHKNMLSLTVSSDEFSEPRSWVFLPSDFPYMMLYCWSTDSGYFADERLYKSSSDYIGGGTLNSVGGSFGFYDGDDYYYQDLYTSVKQSDVISQFNYKPTGDEVIDIGFIIYNEPIVLNGKIDFDPSRIDPDGTVALTGDNVYEYTITNGDGGSTVMGDYIENNYTYIYNGDTGGSDGSGSTLAPSVPDVKLDFDNYYEGVDDYVSETEKFFQKVYGIIPEPIMNIIILSFGLLVAVGVIKIIFILK